MDETLDLMFNDLYAIYPALYCLTLKHHHARRFFTIASNHCTDRSSASTMSTVPVGISAVRKRPPQFERTVGVDAEQTRRTFGSLTFPKRKHNALLSLQEFSVAIICCFSRIWYKKKVAYHNPSALSFVALIYTLLPAQNS